MASGDHSEIKGTTTWPIKRDDYELKEVIGMCRYI